MKLSDLVAYLNSLQALSPERVHVSTADEIAKITYAVEQIDQHSDIQQQPVLDTARDVLDRLRNLCAEVDALKDRVRDQISRIEPAYFANSYRLYDEEMRDHETPEYILQRRLNMDADVYDIILSRVAAVSDWHHPALIIRPGVERFVDQMTAFDPLYIADTDYRLLEPCMGQFTDVYQRRLRTCVINKNKDRDYLQMIPQTQMGFVLCYNFFNFAPFEVLRQYLTEIFDKLKPGGVLAMTYNDCDRAHGVRLTESNFTCYTPGRLVKNLAQTLGYDIQYEYTNFGDLAWLELRKPGTLTSLRGGQTLAKILRKDLEKSK